MLRLVLLLLVFVFVPKGYANQLKDVLDMPAQPTERALISLLTDISQVGDRLVAVGAYGHILYSDDGGESWTAASVPVQAALTSLTFVSDTKGWAVGHDAVILVTEDAGETWQRQLDGRATGEKLLASAQAWQQQVQAKIDSGEGDQDALMAELETAMMAADEAQRELEIGPNRPFLDVMFTSELEGYAVGAFGYFFTTTDGGKTWQDSSPVLPLAEFVYENGAMPNLYSITQLADGSMFIVGEFGNVYRSKEGKTGWETVDIGYNGTLFGVFAGSKPGDVVIIGLKGSTFLSNDYGASWRRAPVPVKASLLGATRLESGAFVIVGVAGTVVVADFENNKFTPIRLGLRSHLSSVVAGDEEDLVITGEDGVLRISINGDRLATSYNAEVAK
jgi:photosystem II stability/assembly factor-like uncharacterized protein